MGSATSSFWYCCREILFWQQRDDQTTNINDSTAASFSGGKKKTLAFLCNTMSLQSSTHSFSFTSFTRQHEITPQRDSSIWQLGTVKTSTTHYICHLLCCSKVFYNEAEGADYLKRDTCRGVVLCVCVCARSLALQVCLLAHTTSCYCDTLTNLSAKGGNSLGLRMCVNMPAISHVSRQTAHCGRWGKKGSPARHWQLTRLATYVSMQSFCALQVKTQA